MIMYPKARLRTAQMPELIAEYKGSLKMQTGEKTGLFYQEKTGKNRDSKKMMEKAKEILEKLGQLTE